MGAGLRQALTGLAMVVSLLGLVAPSAGLAADNRRQIEILPDSDYPGNDLRTVQNLTLDQCKATCLDDRSCRAFTYNTKARWCFLKSDFGDANPFVGAVAGKVTVVAALPDLGTAPDLPFLTNGMLGQAEGFRLGLMKQKYQPDGSYDVLMGRARALANDGLVDKAIEGYLRAALADPKQDSPWLEAARLANGLDKSYWAREVGLAGAINAYRLSRTTPNRAAALAELAKVLALSSNDRAAINAYKASLDVAADPAVRAAYLELKATKGFRVIENKVENDGAAPRICVTFSDPLVKSGVDYAPFVTVNGKPPKAVEAKDRQLCVSGLDFGQRYKLSLREGLPSAVDEPLQARVDIDSYMRDRSQSLRFDGERFVLPAAMRHGIPLVSVNTDRARLKLYRIGDRGLTALLGSSQFLSQIDSYSASQVESQTGELVWEGSIDITSVLNREVTTSIPVDEVLPQRKPGIYMVTADTSAPGGRSNDGDGEEGEGYGGQALATQWFLVSDIGLSTFTGTDGLTVFARSLASAKPLAGVEIKLIARNNEILGTAKTDADGKVMFSAGLVRAGSSLTPSALTAELPGKDFSFLDMTRAGFDLSDRGVAGRSAPGAIDIFAWTERGIYRPGEVVHVGALARDIGAEAIDGLPLTFIFTRPDGVEYRRIVSSGVGLGGHAADLPLDSNVMRGRWQVGVHVDPKKPALTSQSFLVDDFLPDRIEFTLASTTPVIEPNTPVGIDVDGRFLYGAPAAGLTMEGEVKLSTSRSRTDHPGFVFGLADEESGEQTSKALEDLAPLDDDGKGQIPISLTDLPSTTRLLEATVTVRLKEGSGRAVERQLTLPVHAGQAMIGLKPEFQGSLPENATGKVRVISLDADGRPLAQAGAKWRLLKLERDYQWYRDGNAWRYEPVQQTRLASEGQVDIGPDGADIPVSGTWGRYRLEVDGAGPNPAVGSLEFDFGYVVSASTTETPDGLEIALDKPRYSVGDTARLKVSPRYAGQLLVTVGSDTLVSSREVSIPAGGGEVDIPVTAGLGAGSYVTATLFRPTEGEGGKDARGAESRMPMRAIGITWLTVDPAERRLAVTLTAPAKMEPRRALQVPVSVSGGGSDAYVIVAAVDVGILNLTRYQAPDPDGWYFGQRSLGLELRDLYGRLIDGSLGDTGKLRTGGDGGMGALSANPPKEKLVAFVSGPVKLDRNGKATVSFDIPQFNGTVRLMAVAWSRTGVGHATSDVTVRDPVVITASLPRFLSPGDASRLRLDVAATDASSGTYRLRIEGNAALRLAKGAVAQQDLALTQGKRQSLTLPIEALDAGEGTILLSLTGTGADGVALALDQRLDIPVRPSTLPVTTQRQLTLAPGRSLTIDQDLLADSVLQGGSVSLAVARTSGFDIASLLMSLDRYPHGCAEQTTSRAMPLLYFNDLAAAVGLANDPDVPKRVQDAIYRVLSYQASAGSFGLWAPGSEDLWLDAYVTDFLSRAREKGYDVPDKALVQALDNLTNKLAYQTDIASQGNDIAYALYVLARNRKAAVNDLRYYADTMIDKFETPLAKAQLAAALSLYGDAGRAEALFARASNQSSQGSIRPVSLTRSDYGSQLRDGAAILALAAEARPVPKIIAPLSQIVIADWQAKYYTSTQEQSWMLLASRALVKGDADLRLSVNGAARTGAYSARIDGEALLAKPVTITNDSRDPLAATVTTVAAPRYPLPPASEDLGIERRYYTLEGEETNISTIAQNQRLLVVLTLSPREQYSQHLLVTDLLPAGFEIDNPSLVTSATLSKFDWLGETQAAHLEFRNDRFVAAIDTTDATSQDIKLAYVVRAVTPGVYDQPAATAEDMYRPQRYARTATGRMEVTAAP